MFDAAQTAIFELMRRDSFPRYQRSPQFLALKRQLERRAFVGREASSGSRVPDAGSHHSTEA